MTALPSEPADDDLGPLASHLQSTSELASRELASLLAAVHDMGKASQGWQQLMGRTEMSTEPMGDLHSLGRSRKVSVSLPEGLTAAVQRRVGRGEFSHYVAEAVARQLELDLLAELAALLEAEHGPVPEEFLAEAEAAWPDHE
jgi:Arc/MetJ-type ribon-helix-helix transcriptional regulator